jgi:hypothetical protein
MADEPIPTHFALPFRWSTLHHAVENVQDSPEDVADCVVAAVLTPLGWRAEQTEFGITDPTFASPVDIEQLISEIEIDEPRARAVLQPIETSEDMTRDEFVANVRVAL